MTRQALLSTRNASKTTLQSSFCHLQSSSHQCAPSFYMFNPLTLRAAKRGLTILEIFNLQTHFLENIWRRNVDHKPDKNSPSNILWIFALFKRYFQKYVSSRRHFLEKLWVWMGQSSSHNRLSAKAQKELPLRSYPYPRYNKPQLVLYEGYVYVGREIDGCGEIFWWQHSFLGLFNQNWPKTCDFRDLSTKSPSWQWGTWNLAYIYLRWGSWELYTIYPWKCPLVAIISTKTWKFC